MKRIIFCLVALLAMCAGACAEEKLSIVATNFPTYDFARQVAGESADVTMLLKPGVEAHSYDPSPSDIVLIGEADLFIYIGGESDAWVESILSGFDGENSPARLRLMDCVEDLIEENDEDNHDVPEYDEHIWTSPVNAMRMVQGISDALCAVDPDRSAIYEASAKNYADEISAIDEQLRGIVESAARHELVFADRFPFLYFVREYGLDYIAAFPSCSAETEASPQTIMALIDAVVRDHIPVVYTIELSAGNVARTIAEETGAGIETLHSMQTVTQSEFEAGESYVSIMARNALALQRGLE